MSSEERDVQEQQTPAGHTIPVPSRDAVFRDLAKVAKAEPPKRPETDDDDRRDERE